MMHRIIEAFTRPHYAVTAIDELIQMLVVGTIFGLIVVVAFIILYRLTR